MREGRAARQPEQYRPGGDEPDSNRRPPLAKHVFYQLSYVPARQVSSATPTGS